MSRATPREPPTATHGGSEPCRDSIRPLFRQNLACHYTAVAVHLLGGSPRPNDRGSTRRIRRPHRAPATRGDTGEPRCRERPAASGSPRPPIPRCPAAPRRRWSAEVLISGAARARRRRRWQRPVLLRASDQAAGKYTDAARRLGNTHLSVTSFHIPIMACGIPVWSSGHQQASRYLPAGRL